MPLFITPMLLAASLAAPAVAPAHSPTNPSSHRWRLHLEATPAQLRLVNHGGSSSYRGGGLSIPGDMSIGFGRALGRHVIVGARLGGHLGRSTSRISWAAPSPESRFRSVTGGGQIAPYVEVRPLPALRVQPFGLVEGGVGLSGMRMRSTGPLVAVPERSMIVTPRVGGRVGVHAFVRPRLSIDADLGLRRQWSYQWRSPPRVSPDPGAPQPTRLTLAATIGLSGWW